MSRRIIHKIKILHRTPLLPINFCPQKSYCYGCSREKFLCHYFHKICEVIGANMLTVSYMKYYISSVITQDINFEYISQYIYGDLKPKKLLTYISACQSAS